MPIDTKALSQFLAALKANNNKPWFDAHRDTYDALRADFIDDVQHLILLIAAFDPAVKHQVARSAIYRINRDIRFSRNKQIYKTNFGAAIVPGGKKMASPSYHVHLDYDGTMMVAGGLYMITPQQLDRIRTAIARAPKRLRDILSASAFRRTFGDLDRESVLSRPPRGYAADHPAIDLLKLKHYAAWTTVPLRPVPAQAGRDWVVQAVAMARVLFPLVSYLRQVSV